MELLKLIGALGAILFPLIFLVGLNLPAKKGMTYSLIIVAIFALFPWRMDGLSVASSMIAGTIKSLSIIYILVGAMFLLNILHRGGLLQTMIHGFQSLTSDRRLQLIIVGFYFVALLEGAAGFGAPAAIVAPLLVLLGFSPLASVTLALIANAVPMTFGAVGTPLVDGIGTPLQLILQDPAVVSAKVNEISITSAFVDLFLGSFMPVLLILLFTMLFSDKKDRSLHYHLEILPFAFISGFIYTFIAYLSARLIGPEFGTLIASLLGLLIVMLLIKYRIILPKEEEKREPVARHELIKAWFPYVLVVLLLILSRTLNWLSEFLQAGTIHLTKIFGKPVGASFDMFYSPGFILLVVAIIIIFLYRMDKKVVHESVQETGKTVVKTAFALIPSLAMVYIFLNSNLNQSGLPAMPDYLANQLSNVFGHRWVYVAPLLGNLGTFISGSTTTSNLMFTGIQYRMATIHHVAPLTYLTTQVLGANTGCMISISKIVSACSVVGLTGKEGKVMRVTLVVAFVYSLLIGILVNWIV